VEQRTNKWRAAYCFLYNFLNFTNQSFIFIIQRDALLMYHIFNYKLQKLQIALGDWLEEKNRSNEIGK